MIFCKSLNIPRTQFPYKIRISSVCRVLVAYPKDPFSLPFLHSKRKLLLGEGGGYIANLLTECLSWSLLPNPRFTESGAGRNFAWDSQAVTRFSWWVAFFLLFCLSSLFSSHFLSWRIWRIEGMHWNGSERWRSALANAVETTSHSWKAISRCISCKRETCLYLV